MTNHYNTHTHPSHTSSHAKPAHHAPVHSDVRAPLIHPSQAGKPAYVDGEPQAFAALGIIAPLLKALHEEGYTTPTPIQLQSIPSLLKGRDILGCAQTGTGKTAAFALPIIQYLWNNKKIAPRGTPRVLILAPTRELAAQIGESFTVYGRHVRLTNTVIFGGVGQGPQVSALNRGVDILVATPGRLLDLMTQGHVKLNGVEVFVLDEADRMLDMGFIRDINKITPKLPAKRHSMFFSATLAPEVVALAKTMVLDPVQVAIEPEHPTVDKIEQKIYFVDRENKDGLLTELLKNPAINRVMVFTLMKHVANKVAQKLNSSGIRADAIHGNKSQAARTQALDNFKAGKTRVLVATDIAARGLDIDGVTHVINYELPNEPESYVHRIGRTARAGADGDAISFCSAQERDFLRAIERLIKKQIPVVRDHMYHSDQAERATGADARPPPKTGRSGGRGYRGPSYRSGGASRAPPRHTGPGNHRSESGHHGAPARAGGTRGPGSSHSSRTSRR